MRLIKKNIVILLALCVTLFLMPTAAFATQNYELWVNNEQITSEHLTVNCGSGTAVYDPSANTLTLTNADITQGCLPDQWLYSGIISYIDGLNIVLSGTNSITNTGGEGISTYQLDDSYQPVPHDLVISGSGTLTISQNTLMYGYGIYCTGALTLNSVDMTINSAASGLWARNGISVNDSTISITLPDQEWDNGSGTMYSFHGINSDDGGLAVANSSITVSSFNSAVYVGGDLTLSSGVLELTSTNQDGIEGSDDASITLNGGAIDITAADQAVSISADKISYNNEMQLISGTLTGTSCKIHKETSTSPIVLPVYSIESAEDINYVLREGLTAVFTPSAEITASGWEKTKGLQIDYYNPMQYATDLDSGYTKLVEYRVFFSELEYSGNTLQGTITLPLPDGCDASTAKIVGGATASTPTATTVSFPLTLDMDQDSGSAASSLMVEYKEVVPAHTHSWASAWTTNTTHHWHECTADSCPISTNSDKDSYGAHVYDNDQDTTCNTCGYVRTVTPPTPSTPDAPEIKEGMNSQWTQGSDEGLRFKSDADYNDFLRVEVNGNILSTDRYTVSSGSTIVVLKSSYLDTLKAGKYTLGIVSTTGTATTNFEIVAAADKSNPQTGDSSTTWSWIALLFTSGVALAVIGIGGKVMKRKVKQ